MSVKLKKQLEGCLAKPRISKADKKKIYKTTRAILKRRGKFFYTVANKPLYYDGEDHLLYNISEKDFALFLSTKMGFDRSEGIFSAVIKKMEDYAANKGQRIQFRKFTHFDPKTGKLYVNRFNGKVYVLDGKDIRLKDLGTDGIFFRDPPDCLPFNLEKSPGNLANEKLFDKKNFSRQDTSLTPRDQKYVLRWWFYSIFFRSLLPTRSILVVYGPPNSFKTETLRAFLIFLFGPDADVNSPAQDVRNLRVAANHSHILFIDDFDESNKNLESELNRMATGTRVIERELYTNNRPVSSTPDAFIGITTKKPHFSREDFIQRVFVIRLDDTIGNISPQVLKDDIIKHRNQIWYEVLNELNKIVKYLNKNKNSKPHVVNFRNAAWSEFLFKANPKKKHKKIKRILKKINEDQITFLLEANPLAKALSLWLKKSSNLNRWVESGRIRKELMVIAQNNKLNFKAYENDQYFGSELKNTTSTFRWIYQVRSERKRGRNRYHFSKL